MLLSHKTSIKISQEYSNIIGHMCYAASKLDAYVFRQVCRLQRRILDESKKLLSVSVNLSRSSILCEEVVE